MRWHGVIVVAMGVLAGCKNLPPPEEVKPTPKVAPVRLTQPLDGRVGRIISVNTRLRFVVLDFSLNQLPQIGDPLDLWRQNAVVGQLKVSGPIRNTIVLADIVSGEPQVGDQTRPQREPERER